MKAEFTFYSDPSHGWAQIPHQFINDLGIEGKITRYSYKDNDCAYLEEDCDLGLFMQKAKEKGWIITFIERNFNHDCAIRNYQRYTNKG
jgi:hypothetical protein